MPTVFLTNPIDPAIHEQLAQRATVRTASATDAATLLREGADADYIVVRAHLPPELFAQAPRLRAAVRHGAGLDMIPMDHASGHGVAVANVPGANAASVAEYAVGQMLGLARLLPAIDRAMRAESWPAARALADEASDLGGKTLVIVGLGNIGQSLVTICAQGFGMKVIGVRRTPAADTPTVSYLPLAQALPLADYLVLACPLTEQTRGLVGPRELALLKRGARIVNVARGPVIDESALADALRSGHVAGAALDVFEVQPLPRTSPLLGLRNVLLSPHLAGITQESMRRMSEGVYAQLVEMFEGRLPRHLCNAEAADAIRARWARLDG